MEPVADDRADKRPTAATRTRFQWRLHTLLLLTATVAAWVAYVHQRGQVSWLRQRIAAMRELAGELIIEDEQQAAIVRLPEQWYDENAWNVYLPPGEYRIHMATRAIDRKGLARSAGQATIAAGRHRIDLLQIPVEKGWKIAVQVDGQTVMEATENDNWQADGGSYGGGQFSVSTQVLPDEPIILFRRIFRQRSASGQSGQPQQPSEGLLIWIERKGPAEQE